MQIKILLCLIGLSSFRLYAGIYGETDDRQDSKYYYDKLFKKCSESVAGLMKKTNLIPRMPEDSGIYKIKGRSLGKRYNLCRGERFFRHFSATACTGFLVAPKILITAGHCAKMRNFCRDGRWIFGYKRGVRNIHRDNIYTCSKVIDSKLKNVNDDSGMDYAIIELDREVLGREPLAFRTFGKPNKGDELVVIGHPSGMPLKISNNAYISSFTNNIFFTANLDTFTGNSGSPVFSKHLVKRNGKLVPQIEGILVRGDRDYIYDPEKSCSYIHWCDKNKGCHGEDVTRITSFKWLLRDIIKEQEIK